MDDVSPFEPTVVGAVARHWRLVLAVVIAILIPTSIFALTRPATYTVTASLTVGDPRGPGVLGGQAPEAPDRYVADQLVVFRSATLGSAAVIRGRQEKTALKRSAIWLLDHTSASAVAADNNVISVTFSAPSSAEAMVGVHAIVGAYGDVVKTSITTRADAIASQLQSSITSLQGHLDLLQGKTDPASLNQIQQLTVSLGTLETRRDQVTGEATFPGSGVAQSLYPSEATTSGKAAALRLMVLAIALGLILGVALAYVRSYRKRVFIHPRDPELLLGAPLLVDLTSLRTLDLLGRSTERDAPKVEHIAHDLFAIAAALLVDQRLENDKGGLSLAVVSAESAASCTGVAWRSALALTSQGLRVLLVDVDGAWQPSAGLTAGVAAHYSWVEREDGTIGLGEPVPTHPVGRLGERSPATTPRVSLSVCEEPPPVRSQNDLRAVFRELEDKFDIVLVNAPPFLPTADAAYVTSAAGTALIVVPDGARVADHEELIRRLRIAAVMPIGYVYCRREREMPGPQRGASRLFPRAFRGESKSAGAPVPKTTEVKGTRLTTGRR